MHVSSRPSFGKSFPFCVVAFATAFSCFGANSTESELTDTMKSDQEASAHFEIDSNRDFERVEKLMNESDAGSVVVTIRSGSYKLKDSFHINRSDVSLVGEGEVALKLKRGVLTPVIAIGSQSSYPSEDERISNIVLSDLHIDGNREKQKSEYQRDLPWIRNNGVDVRVVSNLKVERVTSNNNRSGGLVISWRCRDVMVRDCVFENNYFDGVAYYDSERVQTVDCQMRDNLGAGVSLDNAFVDSVFVRCLLENNRDVGVFARHSERLVFFECEVRGSGNWAFFLAHDDNGKGVFDIEIASCTIKENRGGLRMGSETEQQSARTVLAYTEFANNQFDNREDLSTAGSHVVVQETPWSDQGDSDPADTNPTPYSKRIYQVLSTIDELNRG